MKHIEIDKFTFYNADCMEIMKQYPDKYFDLAIVDPPYGKKPTRDNKGTGGFNASKNYDNKADIWDVRPDSSYFVELKRISKNQIIWGANYFVEYINKPTKGWVVWYKGQEGLTMSDAELAFSSFDSATRVVKINRVELLKEGTIHPTQKPIKLYDWLLNQYASEGDLILDTHVGSGSSRIACEKGGFNFIGFEIDKDYYEKQEKRFKNHSMQQRLF